MSVLRGRWKLQEIVQEVTGKRDSNRVDSDGVRTPSRERENGASSAVVRRVPDFRELVLPGLRSRLELGAGSVREAIPDETRSEPQPTLLSQFYRSGPLVGERIKRLEFEPSGENRCEASNCHCRTNEVTIYVNGITFGEKGFLSSASAVAHRYGSKVIAIVNDQERSIALDVLNGAAGVLSSKLGRWAERDAVDNTIKEIRAALGAGKPVRMIAYSQGAIIVSNALSEIKEQLGAEKFSELGIVVDSYGAATHQWPTGIKVTEYRLEGDYVSRGTSWVDSAKEKAWQVGNTVRGWGRSINNWWNGTRDSDSGEPDYQIARVVELPCPPQCSDPHDICSYLTCRAEFYLKSHCSDGKLNEQAFLDDLTSSIQSGRFSDGLHDEIISLCSKHSGLAKTLFKLSTTGAFGDYKVSEKVLAKLQAHAELP